MGAAPTFGAVVDIATCIGAEMRYGGDVSAETLARKYAQPLLVPIERRDERTGCFEPAAIRIVRLHNLRAGFDTTATLERPVRQLRVLDVGAIESGKTNAWVICESI